MIYICSLYSNGIGNLSLEEQKTLLQKRVDYTAKCVYNFLLEGKFPYSPILHCHEMSFKYNLPKDYDFWQSIDRNAIGHCSEVYVLKMCDSFGNWEDSKGITDEINYANNIGKKITYFDCEDYE